MMESPITIDIRESMFSALSMSAGLVENAGGLLLKGRFNFKSDQAPCAGLAFMRWTTTGTMKMSRVSTEVPRSK